MVYEQYDFTRNPVVEDEVFFLESRCVRCGSTLLTHSLEEILQEEKRHRTECKVIRASS
jgi:hypothetical protein